MKIRSLRSLHFKAGAVAVALITITLISVLVPVHGSSKSLLLETHSRHAQNLAKALATASVESIQLANRGQAERQLQGFAQGDEVLFVAIFEGDQPFASLVRNEAAWRAYRDQTSLEGHVGEAEIQAREAATPTDWQSPEEGKPPRAVIALSSHWAAERLAQRTRLQIWISLLLITVSLVVVIPLVGRWSTRLRKILEATDKMTRGDFTQTFPEPGTDEIGLLSVAYENMRGKVQQRDQELRSLAETLQERVEERTRDLEHAKQAAVQASRTKSLFLANMSHEIRTPMNGIIGVTDLLDKTELKQRQRDYLATISSSASSLLRIIDDILDFSRIEAGKLTLEQLEFNFEKLLAEVTELLGPRASSNGVHITSALAEDFPPRLSTDASRLRQVLVNLVSNAIKFTSQGGVVIRGEMHPPVDGMPRLRVQVEDTGIGISAEALPHLFDAFTQADSSTTRHFGGTGLGLAISKRLVELLGGRIWVESEVGKGSTFWFEVPVVVSQEPWSGESSVIDVPPGFIDSVREEGESQAANRSILVAEDHPVNRTVTLGQLEELGYRAEAVTNGYEVLKALDERYFDLVLMDCQMPELDGYETSRRIRAREAEEAVEATVKIIAVTAHAMKGDRERCLAVGMDDYLAKPFRTAELASMLARWLDPPADSEEPTRPSISLTSVFDDSKTTSFVDEKVLQSLEDLGERTGKNLLRRVLETFLRTTPETLANLRQAMEGGDDQAAAAAAHSIKGSAAAVGAVDVSKQAAEIEKRLRGGVPVKIDPDLEDLEGSFIVTETILKKFLEGRP